MRTKHTPPGTAALLRERRRLIIDKRASGKAGWGIGLTFVRGMVQAHGGTVSIESSEEGGTTFTVRNPMDSRPFQGGG